MWNPYIWWMKIKFISIGKTGKSFLEEGENEYMNRLKHYVSFERIDLPDIKNAKKYSLDELKILEGKEFIHKAQGVDYCVLLDEKGDMLSSKQFADFFQQKFNAGGKTIAFIVGGAYGFSEEVYRKFPQKISLSAMTFSHQMIRMIFFEQVYRAMTILRGEPYHHD